MQLALLVLAVLATTSTQSDTDGCPGVFVFFDSGSSRLTEQARTTIDQILPSAREMLASGAWLNLHGNSDEIGTATTNLALSHRRAEAVRAYLATQGVRADQIRIIAFGETRPLAVRGGPSSDDEVHAQNRNVNIGPEMPRAVFERFFPPGGAIC